MYMSVYRSDCLSLLERCLDRSRATSLVTPGVICDELSASDDKQHCISLNDYTGQSLLWQSSLYTALVAAVDVVVVVVVVGGGGGSCGLVVVV